MGVSLSVPCNAISDFISHCSKGTARGASYVHKLEENLEALQKALEELIARKNDVERKVAVAEEQQQRRCLNEVSLWISRIQAMETEVNEQILQRRTEEISRLCLWGCCSTNCWSSYKFGKKVSDKLAEVTDLRNWVFEVVAEREPLAPVIEVPVEPTVGLESLFDKVWRDLNDENVKVMGLYGVGGVGKTTLLKKINNNFLNGTNNYDVIWVVVSKDHTLEKIQNDIGEKIGYSAESWKSRNDQQKVEDIFKVLRRKKFVLLLDDIWERIDLVKVGVPLPSNQNGSKLVFTTRSMDVCFRMAADKHVEVTSLSWEKSWDLFREKVGQEAFNFHPDILDLAKTVAKECDGLPLALITIGRAMACKKTPQEWKYAIQVLKNSASDFSGMGDEVFPLLKFSYDNLSNDKARSCFLYCALFPEDWQIEKDDLIHYWMCEGLLDEYADINDLQGQGYSIIGSLLYACLLEESSEGTNHVTMHDVIRDMALWIACGCGNGGNKFLVKTNALLLEPPMVEKWNETERISLMSNRMKYLPGTPTCPNLLTLFLHYNDLRRFSDSFFESMPKLTVLDLSMNKKLRNLPLQISNLVSLQYLNLAGTDIEELPIELNKLAMLKYLNLEGLSSLDKIPKQVISRLSRLQVLNMYDCGMSKEIVENKVQCGGNKSLVQELRCLNHIITLGVSIKCVIALKRFLNSQMLLNSTQSLRLQYLSSFEFLNLSSLLNMEHLDRLSICNCESLEELKIDWDLGSQVTRKMLFQSLGDVSIQYCHKLKELTGLVFAPNMRRLLIYNCNALEEVISFNKLRDAPDTEEPLPKLETLRLTSLLKLKNIYSKPLPFQCLKLIDVLGCEKLKKLPINSNITRAPNLTIRGQHSWFRNIEWEDETTKDVFGPCFDAYPELDHIDRDAWV